MYAEDLGLDTEQRESQAFESDDKFEGYLFIYAREWGKRRRRLWKALDVSRECMLGEQNHAGAFSSFFRFTLGLS